MNKPVAWMYKTTYKNETEIDVISDEFKQSGKGGDCSEYSIPLYTHPVKKLFKDAENRDELISQEFETYLEKLTQGFKEGFKEGVLFCEDVARRSALYGQDTHPAELTDEEIDFIFFDLPSGHSIQEFARAILRKAQENG